MGRRVADRRREEQVAPRLAVRLRVLEADGLEALANGARRLVAGQEALAGQHHGVRRLDELVRVLLEAHLRRRGARRAALLRRERLRRHERRRRRAEGQGEDGGLHRGPAVRCARGEWCKFFYALQRRSFCDAAAAREATSLGSGLRPRKSLQSGLQRMRSLTVRFCCTCVPWYCFAMPAAVLKVRGCNAASRSVDVILAVLRVREIASQF